MSILTGNENPSNYPGDNLNGGYWEAQGFKLSSDARVSGVSFYMQKGSSGSFDSITISIRSGNNGDGAVIYSENFSASLLKAYGGNCEWVDFNFSTPQDLVGDTQYCVRYDPVNSSGGDCLRRGYNGSNPYPDGTESYGTLPNGSANVSSGSDLSFRINGTSVNLPTVVTNEATDITTDSAILNGEITDVGVDNCDYRGFVWGKSSEAGPGDTAPADSDYTDYWTESGDFSAEAFAHALASLDPSTTYYVRACAHNSDGWAYGDEISFATEAVPPWRFENIGDIVMNSEDHQTIWAERLNEILDRLHDLDGLEPSDE